jgi:hypothetical protein
MSAYLDKDTIFVLTYQYHTEKDQTEPSGQKNDRSKSRYRMLGRIMKKADMEEAVYRMHSDENALKPWIWPDDPSWNGRILYMYDSNQKAFSNWLRLKIKKAVDWDSALKILQGYKKDSRARFAKSTPESEKYVRLNPNSAYIVKGYTCSDGDVIDITDRETLLKKVGQNVWFEIPLRSQAEKRN